MSNKNYDPKLVQYVFDVNERLGIPEEQTALAIAKDFGKEKELEGALKGRKKGWHYRIFSEDITAVLERVCKPVSKNTLKEISSPINGKYILMPTTPTYAKGVHALRKVCQEEKNIMHPGFSWEDIHRPLTFKENIEARVHDYESNKNSDERLRLFQRWNDSCTAVAYKKGTTNFKIVPISQELITIREDFNQSYIKINYDSLEEIESDRNDAIYNSLLTKKQIENHPAGLAALEGDLHLLKTYRDIVFAEKKTETAMGFWLRTEILEDQLRALFVSNLGNNSGAGGDGSLNGGGSFLRVAPVVGKKFLGNSDGESL